MSALVAPLVSCTVKPTTLLVVGAMVFCALVVGFCKMQTGQVLEVHEGNTPAPLLINTWPLVPVPMFCNAPVLVVPAVTNPYGLAKVVVPVPPWATATVVKPAPKAPAVKVP